LLRIFWKGALTWRSSTARFHSSVDETGKVCRRSLRKYNATNGGTVSPAASAIGPQPARKFMSSRNQKSRVKDQKPKTENQESKIRNQRSKIENQRSQIKDRESRYEQIEIN
jgi:hypothetical protein